MNLDLPSELTPEDALAQERALRAQGCNDEAERLLAKFVSIWPDDEALLVDWGLLAHEQMRWADMAERFAMVRARHPSHLFAYSRASEALRWLRRFDEAEQIVSDGVEKFPSNLEMLLGWVLTACDRAAWSEAEQRAQVMISRLPDVADAYRFAAEPFRRQQRFSEAELVLAEGLHRLGQAPALMLDFSELASLRQDWPRAALRWTATLERHPDQIAAHRSLAAALKQLGRAEEAEQIVSSALLRFPDDRALLVEHAWMATRRNGLAEARYRWRLLNDRFSDDPSFGVMLAHVSALMGAEAEAPREAAGSSVTQGIDEILADPKRLMLEFESLGENCEFGLIQRTYGAEPISLMRWTSLNHEQLLQALQTNFEGVGSSEHTVLGVTPGGEYMVSDRRFGFGMHTFIRTDQVEGERFLATQAKRMRFLVDRFRETTAAAEKILVRFSKVPIPPDQISDLHDALRRFGPVVLLYVTKASDPAKVGSVEWLEGGIMRGFLDRLGMLPDGNWDISHDAWLSVCRGAFALRAEGRP